LYEQAKSCGYLSDRISDEALSAAEALIETPDFTPEELRELCDRANLVNQKITGDKLLKAVRHPKKALMFLLGKLTG
jgi:hypothetical protein